MVCLFFSKQKTAYELRISDWSSDVYSSDLQVLFQFVGLVERIETLAHDAVARGAGAHTATGTFHFDVVVMGHLENGDTRLDLHDQPIRAEERRVGKECVSTGRSGLLRYN